MSFLAVGLASFLASSLTLFSGFGLGTLLLPAFALFFPAGEAVALTALVHFANNLFKLALLGRRADAGTVLRFGLPGMAAAYLGARTLLSLSHLEPLAEFALGGRNLRVLPINLAVAGLMLAFAALELLPGAERLSLPPRWLPLGGALSGFFGGLSGHQGALRSAFLVRAGLGKEAFLATGVLIACLVDLTRLPVYAAHLAPERIESAGPVLLCAALCAFAGAWLGARLLHKTTLRAVRLAVAGMLVFIALGLGSGALG